MAIILFLTETILNKIRVYKIFDSIDIHCEVQQVPFAQLLKIQPESRVPSLGKGIAEAIGYRNLDRSDWAERGI